MERETVFKNGENTWKIYLFAAGEKNGSGQCCEALYLTD